MNENEKYKDCFKPAWWLPGAHLQTLWPTFCRRKIKNIPLQRERIELADGDFIDLNWTEENNGPIVLILHGLEGSLSSPYAKGMLYAMRARGWRGVLMHFRGCSGEMNRSVRSYHSGETEDLANIIEVLMKHNKPLAAVGFSLGGNVLLKWLGESGKNNPLQAAVAISVPFDLSKAVMRIQKGFSRVYDQHFVRMLCKKMRNKFAVLPAPIELSVLEELRTLRDFDDKITAPLHGFLNADDYYHKCSSRQFLKNISVPTLLLQAKDDPFMTEDLLPHPFELSSDVTLELTEQGGHVGFVSGSMPWRATYWLEKRVPQFLKEYL
ncbi:MAG TPA: hydrolase [Gammaproteobacteria bacterium]|nr:hydrolase [Gammaproteobacteria bacterium]